MLVESGYAWKGKGYTMDTRTLFEIFIPTFSFYVAFRKPLYFSRIFFSKKFYISDRNYDSSSKQPLIRD